MDYIDTLMEEADMLLEASSRRNNSSNMTFFDKLKNGTLPLHGGSKEVNNLVSKGVIIPYGFQKVEIKNQRDLDRVLASIKRRRDIQAARACLSTVIGAGVTAICAGASYGADWLSQQSNIVGPSTSSALSALSDIGMYAGYVVAAFTAFVQIVNVIDFKVACNAISEVRANMMDAYERVSAQIYSTKPAGTDLKAQEKYHEMLRFRDSLRNMQLSLSRLGSVGANSFVTASELDKSNNNSNNNSSTNNSSNSGNNNGKKSSRRPVSTRINNPVNIPDINTESVWIDDVNGVVEMLSFNDGDPVDVTIDAIEQTKRVLKINNHSLLKFNKKKKECYLDWLYRFRESHLNGIESFRNLNYDHEDVQCRIDVLKMCVDIISKEIDKVERV